MSIKRIDTNQRMSQVVVHNNVAYLAGQVPDDLDADIQTQAKQVLAKIDALLAKAGSDKSKLLSATVWLSDIRYFEDMNVIWEDWVPEGSAPARATVQASLGDPRMKIEIGIIAAL